MSSSDDSDGSTFSGDTEDKEGTSTETLASYTTTISESNPAFLTLYETVRTRKGGAPIGDWERRRFDSFEALSRFLGRTPHQRDEKGKLPFFTRGKNNTNEGTRLKKHLCPPYLVILDLDKTRVSLDKCCARLRFQSIEHIAFTTYSHGKISGKHSYRVVCNLLARDWNELKGVTAQVFSASDLSDDLTNESYHTQGFYLPGVHPSRKREHRFMSWEVEDIDVDDAWTPEPVEPEEEHTSADQQQQRDPEDIDLQDVRAALEHVPNIERDMWVQIGMALHSTAHPDAFDVWADWSSSQQYDGFSIDDCERVWSSFNYDGLTTIATLFHCAMSYGFENKGEREPISAPEVAWADEVALVKAGDMDPVVALDMLRAHGGRLHTKKDKVLKNHHNCIILVDATDMGLAYDSFADRKMMLGTGWDALHHMFQSMTRQVDDTALDAIRWRVGEGIGDNPGVEFSVEQIRKAVDTIAAAHSFNPVERWLLGLKWDGTLRLDRWIVDYAKVADSAYSRAVGVMMLKSAVARVLVPGIKYDTMIIFESPKQGLGKSKMVRVFGGEYTAEGLPQGDLSSKDTVGALQGKWFIELGELEASRKADIQALKMFLSKEVDAGIRKAYKVEAKDYPRRCVFIGTTNETEYLKDETGARRFVPVRVLDFIDLKGLQNDRDQLFAEAMVRWKAEPTEQAIEMPPDLWETAATEVEERRSKHPWEDLIRDMLDNEAKDAAEAGHGSAMLTNNEIMEALGLTEKERNQETQKRIGRVMRLVAPEWIKGSHKHRVLKKTMQGYRINLEEI